MRHGPEMSGCFNGRSKKAIPDEIRAGMADITYYCTRRTKEGKNGTSHIQSQCFGKQLKNLIFLRIVGHADALPNPSP
jgi:hypothetical protein